MHRSISVMLDGARIGAAAFDGRVRIDFGWPSRSGAVACCGETGAGRHTGGENSFLRGTGLVAVPSDVDLSGVVEVTKDHT